MSVFDHFVGLALKKIVCCFQEFISGVAPIDYEDELERKSREIARDPLRNILLFPEDDVQVNLIFSKI